MDEFPTLQVSSWETPASFLPWRKLGNFRIAGHSYTKGTYEMYGVDGYVLYDVTRRIRVTVLQELRGGKWHPWMVDDPPHFRAMQIYAEHCSGVVVTTGLGLGLFAGAAIKNPNIHKIVVVEKSKDVIDLVKPHMPRDNRLHIIAADFLEFSTICPRPDWAVIDLWVADGRAEKMKLLPEVLRLAVELQDRWPETRFIYHGFHVFNSPEVVLVTPTALEKVKEFHRYSKGERS